MLARVGSAGDHANRLWSSLMSQEKDRVAVFGCWLSEKVADLAAHPYAQIAVIFVCIAWLSFGGENSLSLALSILAITLTQMVLNKQHERELDASRRDIALHAKLDELIVASNGARNEIAGAEVLELEEIELLKQGNNVIPLVPSGQ